MPPDETEALLAFLYAALPDAVAEDEAGVMDELRKLAASEPDAFKAFFARQPILADSHLFEVYEALFEDEAAFAELLGSEFRRLLELAQASPREAAIYQQLEAFGLAETPAVRAAIADALAPLLQSAAPQLRRFASSLASDALPSADGRLEARLKELVASDPDWRVRVLAHRSLREHQPSGLPPLAFGDRLRMRLQGARLYRYAD